MKTLFFISKPLEMLGAIEARKQFKITQSVLVIRVENHERATIDLLIEKSGNWQEVIFANAKSSYGLSWIRLLKKLQKEPYEYLFARAFPISSYFVHNLKYEKLFLLDDGTATINIVEEFKNQKNLTKRFSLFRGKNKSGFIYSFVAFIYQKANILVEKPVEKGNVYTIYDIESIPNLTIIKNEFQWIQSLKKKQKNEKEDAVFIIGTDVVEVKMLSQKSYITTLKKIAAFYKGKKIIYIPHGRERANGVLKIKNDLGFTIRKNKYNVELDFVLNNLFPTHIVGTISTALITLKLIYKEGLQVDFFNFNEKFLSLEGKENIINIVEYQKKYITYRELNY